MLHSLYDLSRIDVRKIANEISDLADSWEREAETFDEYEK